MTSNGWLIGIDIGTSRIKAGVIDTSGIEHFFVDAPTPWIQIPTGAELDPSQLLDTVLGVLSEITDRLPSVPDGDVVALGITGIAETVVYLDSKDNPIMRSIAWHDSRGEDEAREMADVFGGLFSEKTGLPPSRLCTLAKWRWLCGHLDQPSSVAKILGIAEWIAYRLGGGQVAELSLASRSGMLDVAAGEWWEEALEWGDLSLRVMPELVTAGTAIGNFDGARYAEYGLNRLNGAILTIGGHDHSCGAVGAGVIDNNEVFDSCGTAEALIRATCKMPDGDAIGVALAGHVTVGRHALPGRFVLLGAQRAGLVLGRILKLIGYGTEEIGSDRMSSLERDALDGLDDIGELKILNAESNLASITGIGWDITPVHIWRAAVSTVTDRMYELLNTISTIGGHVDRIAVSGGWSRSLTLRAAKEKAAGSAVTVDYLDIEEPGIRGAALFAGCAASVFDDISSAPRPVVVPSSAGDNLSKR